MTACLEEKLEAMDTTEAHWSVGTVLAIFFAASLISAVFFGLGYSLGGGETLPSNAVVRAAAASESARPVDAEADRANAQPLHAALRTASAMHGTAAGAVANSSVARCVVQVGALDSRRDARRLATELRKSGFHPGIYPGKHDKYLHVEIGPFATLEQADIMRHRVMAHGYRAVVKRVS
jgi:cell division septation protein DedD